MSACYHLPTFNQRLSSNFGILAILSIIVSLNLVISQEFIDSSNQFQPQEAAVSNVLDCNQYLKDNNISEDLIQGDTSDEVEAKVKRQANLSVDCMNHRQAYQRPSTNFRHQQNANNNHELATSVEPIYFERYPSGKGDFSASDRSENYPPIYDANPRNNPFTNPFYMFGAESPPQYQAKNVKLTSEPTSDDNSNYVYNNGSNVTMKIPFRDNELNIPPSLLKPFESMNSQQNEQFNNSAVKFPIPLAKSAQKQFELSAIYGIKHDNTEDELQKYKLAKQSLSPRQKHQKQLINIDKILSANTPQVKNNQQQVKLATDLLLSKLQEVNSARGGKDSSSLSQMKKPDKTNSRDKEINKSNKTRLGNKFLNDLYRSSILKRLRQKPPAGSVAAAEIPANISNILKPGQVLLSEKKSEDNQQMDKEVGTVHPSDIVGLLRKLKPLMVSENERPEAEKVDHENRAIDEDFELEKEELEELKRQNKVNRVLPTSHLFGGSVGIVNETKIKPAEAENDTDTENSNDEDDEQENENDENNQDNNSSGNNSNKVEDLQFLKTLTDLGSKLGKEPHTRNGIHPIDGEFYELYGNNKKNRRNVATSSSIGKSDSKSESSNDDEKSVPPIEIEKLVDHLMSSSRLATFGIQHTGVKVPKNNNIYEDDHEPPSNDDEEEDEEEEDNNGDDDSDNNDTLPPPDIVGEKEAESNLSETKVLPSFDSVANMSDTWIPLDSVEVNNKQLLLNKDNKQDKGKGLGAVKSKAKKKKRKKRKKGRRKKRDKRGKGDLVLIVGDKMLSKTDLIRLIRVLNKMASKKEASREREASRRLLRFLVKLALEEYRKNKESNHNDSLNDPIREVLRSVLLSPVYGKEFDIKNGTSIGEIQLKPLVTSSLNEGETKSFLKKTYGDGNEGNDLVSGKPLKKSLNDLSDDLELYFESDFFEDLADKRDNSSKKASAQNIKITKLKPDNKKLRKLKRASRLGYSLPVPIYGKQHIEAADEDDTDLDHVKLKKRPTNSRRSVLRKKPLPSAVIDDDDDDVEEESKRKSLPRRRPPKRSREIKSEPTEDADEEAAAEVDRDKEREEASQDPEPDEERQSRPPLDEGEEKITSDDRLNNPRSPVRRRQTIKSNPSKMKRLSTNNQARDNDDSGEPDPSSVITGEFDTNIESHDDPDSEPDKVPGAENLEVIEKPNRSKLVSKKQRKKRRQRIPGSIKRGNLVKEVNKVDLDDRDEIPAPINGSGGEGVEVTGHQLDDSPKNKSAQGTEIKPKEATKKVKKKSVPSKKVQNKQQLVEKSKGSKHKLVDAKNVQKQTNKGKIELNSSNVNMKKLDKDEKIRKRNVRHKSLINHNKHTAEPTKHLVDGSNDSNSYLDPDEPASEEPEPTDSSEQGESGEPQDSDYFNEGTSYSKVCEDDGKCHVSVQSSSPKLSKAIKARDKPLIVKHLGNWVSNGSD